MSFTPEQKLAINTSGQNIIVSAGAGSGKTGVLTERIYRKIKNGTDVTRLLVLTFTKAAALEMKTRIKEALEEDGNLKEQILKIDSAYITTFDSFALSVVQKYYYLLGVRKDIKIGDSILISLLKEEILNSIFEDLYKNKDSEFEEILTKFTFKDDETFKSSILKIANKLEKLIGRDEYLANYVKENYTKEVIDSYVKLYVCECNERLKDFIAGAKDIQDFAYGYKLGDYMSEMIDFFEEDHSYEAIVAFFLNYTLPNAPTGNKELQEVRKKYKEELDKFRDNFLRFTDVEAIKESLVQTEKYVNCIIRILQQYFRMVWDKKNKENIFEFDDIAMLVLRLLKKNEDVRNEISKSFDEILLDEYQDTSDVQEETMRLISNNNIYMVGDIKQSIYRFRNANPMIFKNKYDKYKNNEGGLKIDLNKNFRSRKEVLNNINLMFNHLMTESTGDANYITEHQMNYGNDLYDDPNCFVKGFNYNQEYLMYDEDESKVYKNEEIEAYIIANKIKELVNQKFTVYDKKLKKSRDLRYKDIAVILPRKEHVDLISKVFTSQGIPLNISIDEKISDSPIIRVICSVLNLVRYVKDFENQNEYAFYFVSVARSFLFRKSDNWILQESLKYYQKNEIYNMAKKVYYYSRNHSMVSSFEYMLKEFDFYGSIVKLGDVDKHLTVINYVADTINNLADSNLDFDKIAKHFESIMDEEIEISYSNTTESNGVILINIHKSKGLEYPVCFFADLTAGFNRTDVKESFLFDESFGLITPYFAEAKEDNILKILYKHKYIKADISERIRLFYVALTRAREKMYFVMPKIQYLDKVASPFLFSSYSHFISYYYEQAVEKYVVGVDYKNIVSKNYLNNSTSKLSSMIENLGTKYTYNTPTYKGTVLDKTKISKKIEEVIDSNTAYVLNLGNRLHQILQTLDFSTFDLEILNITDKEKEMLKNVLELKCFENVKEANIYKEYEFMYDSDGKTYHGIIDLLLEYEDHFEIIDYKLSDIDKPEYQVQLNEYYKYLSKITDKPIKMYLLSLTKAKLEEVNVIQ